MPDILEEIVAHKRIEVERFKEQMSPHEIHRRVEEMLGSASTYSVREKIRTPDTLVRSQVLYPAELHTHNIKMYS